MKRFISLAVLASLVPQAGLAQTAQVAQPQQPTAGYPVTLSDGSRVLVRAMTAVDANGNPTSAPSSAQQGSTTSGQSGTLSMCAVVTGNQSYTVGTTQPCNLTPTGRLKVGLSTSTNIAPATNLTTTLDSDLIGCIYRATPPAWSDGYTGAVGCDNLGRMNVLATQGTSPWVVSNGGTFATQVTSSALPSGAATSGNQSTQITAEQAIQANQTNGTANAYVIPSAGATAGVVPVYVLGSTSLVVKNSAGNLYGLQVQNGTTAANVAVINTSAVPASGASISPFYCMPLAASQALRDTFPMPLYGSNGFVIVMTTSCTTYSIPGTATAIIAGYTK